MFGKPEDLTAFAERLSKDESFRDEMASMVRAIIYRERDGLTPTELMELLIRAVGGGPADDGPKEVRDAVRQITGFAAGVFRSRWNPGGSVAAKENDADFDGVAENIPPTTPTDVASRPMTPIFYQAQIVANGGEEPEAAEAPAIAEKPKAVEEQEVILPLRGKSEARVKSEADDEPTLSFAGYASQPEPVVTFLRGEGARQEPLYVEEPRRSGGWGWAAAILAVVVAFCAGMYARQQMITRYGPAWPWHVPTAWMPGHWATPPPPAAPPAPTSSGVVPPTSGGPVSAQNGTAAQPRKPAQVESARSAWTGGTESAQDLSQPTGVAPASDATTNKASNAESASHGEAADSATGSDGLAPQPIAGNMKAGSGPQANDLRSARVTAMVGAPPSLMASHLLFAPEPKYPQVAKLAHVQGPVVVEALVGRDGSVVRAHAISGNQLLRGAAEEAVMGRRYRPYVENDIPMAIRTLVTIDFRPR